MDYTQHPRVILYLTDMKPDNSPGDCLFDGGGSRKQRGSSSGHGVLHGGGWMASPGQYLMGLIEDRDNLSGGVRFPRGLPEETEPIAASDREGTIKVCLWCNRRPKIISAVHLYHTD